MISGIHLATALSVMLHMEREGEEMERAYTVSEIDALRNACEARWLFGTTNMQGTFHSRSYKSEEKDFGVEQLVRTYMMAGKIAEDIYEADKAQITK